MREKNGRRGGVTLAATALLSAAYSSSSAFAPTDSITISLDVRPFLPAKLAALRGYASQIGPSHLLSALPDDLAEEFLGREYFVRIRPPEEVQEDWLDEALPQA